MKARIRQIPQKLAARLKFFVVMYFVKVSKTRHGSCLGFRVSVEVRNFTCKLMQFVFFSPSKAKTGYGQQQSFRPGVPNLRYMHP